VVSSQSSSEPVAVSPVAASVVASAAGVDTGSSSAQSEESVEVGSTVTVMVLVHGGSEPYVLAGAVVAASVEAAAVVDVAATEDEVVAGATDEEVVATDEVFGATFSDVAGDAVKVATTSSNTIVSAVLMNAVALKEVLLLSVMVAVNVKSAAVFVF